GPRRLFGRAVSGGNGLPNSSSRFRRSPRVTDSLARPNRRAPGSVTSLGLWLFFPACPASEVDGRADRRAAWPRALTPRQNSGPTPDPNCRQGCLASGLLWGAALSLGLGRGARTGR